MPTLELVRFTVTGDRADAADVAPQTSQASAAAAGARSETNLGKDLIAGMPIIGDLPVPNMLEARVSTATMLEAATRKATKPVRAPGRLAQAETCGNHIEPPGRDAHRDLSSEAAIHITWILAALDADKASLRVSPIRNLPKLSARGKAQYVSACHHGVLQVFSDYMMNLVTV